MKFPRIYADEQGETHIGVLDVSEHEACVGITTFCLSDGIVDAHDRLYAGDIGYTFFDTASKPVDTCVIACLDPDGRARVVARDLSFPNGIVVTPDGKTMIVAETMGHRLTAFDVQADGSLANRRVYAQAPEDVCPDGIALDAEGACGSPTRKANTLCCGSAKAARSSSGSSSTPRAMR